MEWFAFLFFFVSFMDQSLANKSIGNSFLFLFRSNTVRKKLDCVQPNITCWYYAQEWKAQKTKKILFSRFFWITRWLVFCRFLVFRIICHQITWQVQTKAILFNSLASWGIWILILSFSLIIKSFCFFLIKTKFYQVEDLHSVSKLGAYGAFLQLQNWKYWIFGN